MAQHAHHLYTYTLHTCSSYTAFTRSTSMYASSGRLYQKESHTYAVLRYHSAVIKGR